MCRGVPSEIFGFEVTQNRTLTLTLTRFTLGWVVLNLRRSLVAC